MAFQVEGQTDLAVVLAAVDAAHQRLLQLAEEQRSTWEACLQTTLQRITKESRDTTQKEAATAPKVAGEVDETAAKLHSVAQVQPETLHETENGMVEEVPVNEDSWLQLTAAFNIQSNEDDPGHRSVSTNERLSSTPRLPNSLTMKNFLKDDEKHHHELRRRVRSNIDYIAGLLVLLNGVLMLAEFELEGRQSGTLVGYGEEAQRTEFVVALSYCRIVDAIFAFIFLLEWLLRVVIDKRDFLLDITNWFDTVLVLIGLVEVVLFFTLEESSPASRSIVLLRMMRVLKSLRAVRMVRSLRFFRGLRLLIKACQCFLPSLCWAMVLLGIMMTMGALLLGNLLQTFIVDETMDLTDRTWIWERYGTAYRASYTLFEITFAGSWPSLTRPVLEKVSDLYVIFFVCYITVIVFAIIRVIGAVFLKDTLEAAQNDAEQLVMDRLRMKEQFVRKLEGIFHSIDAQHDGLITEERLKAILAIPRVEAYFQTMDLDVREGQTLFHLIDNGDGEVTLEEFIDGIMRCKGPARAIDQVAMQAEFRQLDNKVTKALKWISKLSKRGVGKEDAFNVRSRVNSENASEASMGSIPSVPSVAGVR